MFFVRIFIAALAYFVFARLGTALAIPPDYAAAVWPAAGVALASFLLFSRTVAFVGVMAGAVFANLYTTTSALNELSMTTFVSGVAMGAGATLQGLFGAWLYRTYLPGRSRWDELPHLIRFCFVVVALGSVVSTTIGNITLYVNEFIVTERLAFNWITWWAGDAIGALLVTPVIMVLAAPEKIYSRDRKIKVMVPILLILAAVFGLFYKSVGFNRERIVSDLQAAADELSQLVDARLTISENKLIAYAALFSASEFVTPEEFARFSERVMSRDDAFFGVGWTEVVDNSGRARWETFYRERGFDGFTFTELAEGGRLIEASDQETYYPVLYIYPFERNRRAFGLNLGANAERKTALDKAAIEHVPVATAPIVLAQETGKKRAILLYMPVFDLEDDEALVGYSSGVLKVSGILGESVFQSRQAGLYFNLYDVTDGERLTIYEASEQAHSNLPMHSYDAYFGTRKYHLEIFPAENYVYGRNDWTSYVILTGGFVIATLFLVFVLTTTGQIETVRRQVELRTAELSDAVSRANAASDAKSAFLANMSHELRTPLNAINGFLKLVLDTALTPVQKNYLQKADLASVTLLGLINQTLNYAKIESGNMELEQSTVRMRRIARKMEALFGHIADESALDFRIKLANDVPEVLIGDELRIEQITLNLLSNAFKFTREGHIDLNISYEVDDEKLQIRVTDSGVGIPADKMEHIFAAFGQADASISRRYGGSGLGLSISRRIAIMMKGDILVRSTEGQGSEFLAYLHLPVGDAAADDVGAPESCGQLQGKCALIVEDIKVNQMIVQEFLSKHGISTLVAENGREAVDQMAARPAVDFILMDVQMPVMDGYAATREIRKLMPEIPIIGMTANAMDDDKMACLAAGMNDHIAKPIDPENLIRCVQDAVSKCG